jgi:hypothetical protein
MPKKPRKTSPSTSTPLWVLRKQVLKMTQERFGETIGLAQSSVSLYETGRDQLTSARALQIWSRWRRELVGLNYSLEDLLRGGGK